MGELGKRMIKGLQQEGLVATPKHFAVYSIPVGGRDAGTRTDPHVAPRARCGLFISNLSVRLSAKPEHWES